MLCPSCHRENQLGNAFCIYCGTPLRTPDIRQSPSSPGAGQLQPLLDEILQLRETVNLLNDRLTNLEQAQGIASPPPEPSLPRPDVVFMEPSVRMPEEPVVPKPTKPAEPKEWEQIFGGSWLARIGIVALIIGIAFFLKFAADRNWLNVIGWGILGILSGLVLVWAGHFWRKKYPTFAQALSGGGVAVLYLSIFAAFTVFHFIPVVLALVLFLVIGVGAALLANMYSSMALAIITMIGAFSAPLILRQTGAAYTGQGVYYLAYLVIVDIGVLVLSTMRNWRWLTLFALVGSLIAFGGWYEQFGNRAGLLTSEIGLTLIFLIFVASTTLFHVIRKRKSEGFDYTLMVINAAGYYLISLGLMLSNLRAWMGGFTLLLALFYGGFTYLILSRKPEDKIPGYFSLGTGIAFLTIAIPVQFEVEAWGTVAWAVEAAILLWLSFKIRMTWLRIFSYFAVALFTIFIPFQIEAEPWIAALWAVEAAALVWLSFKLQIIPLRIFSYVVFAFLALHLFAFDTALEIKGFRLLINERVLAFLFGIAAIYFVASLLVRQKKYFPEFGIPATVFLVAGNFFTLWVISFELWSYFDSLRNSALSETSPGVIRNTQNLSITGVWMLYAVVLLVIGIWRRWRVARLTALGILAAAILKVIFYDIWTLEIIYRVIACVGLGVLLLVSAYLYQRYRKAIAGFLTK